MMRKQQILQTAVRLGAPLGVNAIPAAGLLLGGWAPETAILLYLAVFPGICAAPFGEWLFVWPFVALKTMVDVGQPIQLL
jgi:hypothetical protein